MRSDQNPTTPEIQGFYQRHYPPGSEIGWAPAVYTLENGYHLITDGHHLLSIPGSEPWHRTEMLPVEEPYRGPGRGQLLKLTEKADLDQWVGLSRPDEPEPQAPWTEDCGNCGGGKMCMCGGCEDEHECRACDARGLVWEWPRGKGAIIRRGWPGIDLNNLGRALYFFPEMVEAAPMTGADGEDRGIIFKSGQLLAFVMGYRTDNEQFWEAAP